ncbi:nuclear pore membrane glycoprotein 210-like [Carassius carassius]|uniref:nuclear pore membrane glycoprotein 210-like n=1 Tax=Carassius carassius TaxID=217509 RepID=UPI0028684F52|nr:nuclear pore membrane glycoprotein 210-like [Carassius carassius]
MNLSARLPVSPGIYSDQTDIILSHQHPSAKLTVYGPPAALQQLHVKSSSPAVVMEQKEVSPSYIRYTVRAVEPQGPLTASVSSVSSAQVLHIPVSVMHLAHSSSSVQTHIVDGADRPSILQQFIDSYQVMFFPLFSLLAATAVVIIVCHALFSQREHVNHPAFIQKTPPPAGVAKLTESPFNSSMSSDTNASPRLLRLQINRLHQRLKKVPDH